MPTMPLSVRRRLPTLRGLILDIDGVLTDGRLHFGSTDEFKSFHVRDGHGLALLLRSGFSIGIISGRSGKATERRLEELGIQDFYLGVRDKSGAFDSLLGRWNMNAGETGVMGDDVTDLPLLARSGLAITVFDAHPAVRRQAHWLTSAPGGFGAVREVADALLFVRNREIAYRTEDHRC